MTAKEESIVKHKVNCGRLKNRLELFLLGMDSIEEKVHLVFLYLISIIITFNVCTYRDCLRNMPHSERQLFAFRELAKCFVRRFMYP